MSGFQRPSKRPPVDPEALERFAAGAEQRRASFGLSGEQASQATSVAPSPPPAQEAASTMPSPAAVRPNLAPRSGIDEDQDDSRKTSSILWRVTPEERDLFTRVYNGVNIKSRQKLLDHIILPALRQMAEGLDKGEGK